MKGAKQSNGNNHPTQFKPHLTTTTKNNIRMKKILYTLIALFSLSLDAFSETAAITETVWTEDFTYGADKQDFSQCGFTGAYSLAAGPGWASQTLLETLDGLSPGESGMSYMSVMNNTAMPGYGYINFDYDTSEISDNWTLEFDYLPCRESQTYYRASNFPQKIAVTGSNADFTQGTELSSGLYLYLNRLSQSYDALTQAVFQVQLGDNEPVGTFTMYLGIVHHIKLQCTNANTNNATLTFTITSSSGGTYSKTQNIDPTSLGDLLGIYLNHANAYVDSNPTEAFLDNFIISKDVMVDATPCSAPTYNITGAYNKGRKFTLECETEGATIYYSETNIEIGEDGWIEYTGETLTEAKTVYAYAYNSANKTTSEKISFATTAGSTLRLISLPTITKTAYDENLGYAFTITPNYEYVDIIPQEVRLIYSIDGGEELQLAEGETAYVTPGSTVMARMEADGYTKSGNNYMSTSVRPQAPELWSQDFATLVNSSVYGTGRMNIVLDGNVSFNAETKSLYGIKQFSTGTQNISINVDNRIGLTTSNYYFLQAGNGIVSTKPEVTYDEEDEEGYDYLTKEDGIGLNGLTDGQYIFVTTTGGEVAPITGCSYIEEASTIYEQIFRAYSNTALIDIPDGVSVKDITIRSNFEPVTTNEYGWATHVSINPLIFSDSEATAYVIEEETRSALFQPGIIDEVPAGTPFILHGEPNTTYELTLGTASLLTKDNLLTVTDTTVIVNNYEKPIYIVDETTGDMVMADKSSTIQPGTLYILSKLDAVKYFDFTFASRDTMALIYDEPLDFRGIENLTAYIITGESLYKGFEWTSVDEIPAGTPVILIGKKGEAYSVPVGNCTDTEEVEDNKLKGTNSNDFSTSSTTFMVYTLSETSGKLEAIDKNTTTTILAGTPYIISRYIGFVPIHTNASGSASLTATQPLTFTEIALKPYIITGETATGITKQNTSEIPAGTAFYVTGGEADSTYNVPIGVATGTLTANRLISMDKDFPVIDTLNYVYALDPSTGEMTRMSEDYIVPAGEAFYVSEYSRKVDLGTETIELPESGFTTYVTEKNLDFNTTELIAYRALGELNGSIMLDRIYEVPAGTPIALRGTPNGKYEVQVIESAASVGINKLQGTREEEFDVNTQDYFVYVATGTSAEMVKAKPTYVVPKGQAYYISENIGVERITLNQYGYASYFSYHPLDFSDYEDIDVRIVVDETPSKIHFQSIKRVKKDEAFLISGTPGKTYAVPVCDCESTGFNNRLTSSHTDGFDVSTAWGWVYAMSAKTGELVKVASTVTIGKNKAYYESDFRGTEPITTNEKGFTSYVCKNPLDFTTVEGTRVEVVIDETIEKVLTDSTLKRLPEKTAFIFWGEPNTTYNIPIRKCDNTDIDNWLEGSLTDDFDVSTYAPYWVYAMSKSQGKFTKVSANTTIPAGKAFFRSKYKGFEEITVSSIGKTTYVCTNPLEFYETEGLHAYIMIDETEDSIYTKIVNEVPAGTAIYVEGSPGKTFQVPIGDSEELPDGMINLFKGSTTDSFDVIDAGDKIVYALSLTEGRFIPCSQDITIPAGKAYFESNYTNKSASAKPISLSKKLEEDEDEEIITSISDIKENTSANNRRFFNLAGQPVDDNYKGIVIDENGKKYYRR